MPRAIVVLAAALLAACGGDPAAGPADGGADGALCVGAAPALPGPGAGEPLLIGAEGVPRELLGAVEAPRFDEAFADLAASGFDTYVPPADDLLGYFLPPDALGPGAPPAERSCASAASPYRAAAGRLRVVAPAAALVPAAERAAALDAAALAVRLDALVATCLAGDDAGLAGWASFAAPAGGRVLAVEAGAPALDLANVGALAAAVRARSQRPLLLVEEPLPFTLAVDPAFAALPAERRAAMTADFWSGVAATAPTADWYGFTVAPVPLSWDLGVGGDWVLEAAARAPQARPLAALQGCGAADLGGTGRRPEAPEARYQAFDAVLHGARGLLWSGQGAMALVPDHELWDGIRATARELRDLAPLLDAPRTPLRATGADLVDARLVDGVIWAVAALRSDWDSALIVEVPPPPAGAATSFSLWVPGRATPLITVAYAPGALVSLALDRWGLQVFAITYC
ncbi:MAG TPA: hypothetical protein VGQ83_26925 [Polyangia bacterium]